jgi:23S rRNA pseudouridine2457 synthase
MQSFRYYAIYKPFGMLSQFTNSEGVPVLGELIDFPKDVYPIGRLDKDSEGLLLLTNDNRFKSTILEPKNKLPKTYWVQVDKEITDEGIEKLTNGSIVIKHNKKPHQVGTAVCKRKDAPDLPERVPPIRYRKNIPTSWIELTIKEGKNRQVRKMTAAAGFPTLRLVRAKIGNYELGGLQPGDVVEIDPNEVTTI